MLLVTSKMIVAIMGTVKSNFKKIQALEQKLKSVQNKKVKVGWFASSKYDDGTPVAGVAAQNEFGNPALRIPPRPFMRPAVAEDKINWRDAMLAKMRSGSYFAALNTLGLLVQSSIQNQIANGNHAKLSPVTIALRRLKNNNVVINAEVVKSVAAAISKGETKKGQLGDQSFGNQDPLRDSGIMLASVTYEIE